MIRRSNARWNMRCAENPSVSLSKYYLAFQKRYVWYHILQMYLNRDAIVFLDPFSLKHKKYSPLNQYYNIRRTHTSEIIN